MNSTLWIENIFIAILHLRTHPLRTILTISGFTVALAALLAMVGIGEGTRQKIIADLEVLGSARVVSIQVDIQYFNNPAFLQDVTNKLSNTDIIAIKRASKHIELVVPTILKQNTFSYRKNRYRGTYLGTTPDYVKIHNRKLEAGRFLTQVDIDYKNKVCVIGSEVKTQLFKDAYPIGQTIHFNGYEFTVVGVLRHWNVSASRVLNQQVLIPISTIEQHTNGITYFNEIFTKIDNIELVPIVQKQIVQILRERHPNFENFKVFSQGQFINKLFQSSNLMSFTFGIISFIILFIGGIGIMNLMLISVTERTKEIGVYKAVGAKDRDIFSLFLFEAIIMSCIGGIAGIILGVSGSKLITTITQFILNNKIDSIISIKILLLAFFSSILLGLCFGIYPALSASRIDPGKALRYE